MTLSLDEKTCLTEKCSFSLCLHAQPMTVPQITSFPASWNLSAFMFNYVILTGHTLKMSFPYNRSFSQILKSTVVSMTSAVVQLTRIFSTSVMHGFQIRR